MSYGPRFEQALLMAHRLHRDQVRRGTGVPYITHLLAVAALVGDHGGSEDQIIAALLHDAVEDQGGLQTAHQIREHFGNDVAAIVDACSDSYGFPKPAWQDRKEAFIARLNQVVPTAHLVILADKVHNAWSMVRDRRMGDPSFWKLFHGGRRGTLWYYETVVDRYRELFPHPMVEDLARAIDFLRQFDD